MSSRQYTLEAADREEFLRLFRPGVLWSRVGAEDLRFWHTLLDEPRRLVLQHGTGAIGILQRDGDRLTGVELLEGDAAEPLLRRYGFQVPEELRRRVRRTLVPGRPLAPALESLFPRRLGLEALPALPIPEGLRRPFRLRWGGLLEVDEDGSGNVRSHRWFAGGEALDRLNALRDAPY